MLHKGMLQGALASAVLAATCLGGVAHAAGQAPGVDRDAAAACMSLGDESRVAQCLEQLQPLPPEEQRVQMLLDDPAVQAAMEAWNRDLESAMAKHAQDLATKGDVRSLLGAMMIMPTRFGSSNPESGRLGQQARSWFSRARELGPTDPLVAWVELFECHALDCDRGAALDHLLRVDGGNAAVHLWVIHDAAGSGDTAAAREHLQAAASAPHFDPHTNQLLDLLLEARSGAPAPAMDARVSTVMAATAGSSAPADVFATISMSQWQAISMVPMQGLVQLCGPGSPGIASDPVLRRDCVALLSMLADDGSMLIYPQLATRLLTEMEPALATQWAPRVRQLAWWQEQLIPLLTDGNALFSATEYAGWMASDGEVGAIAKLLARADIPTDPPADWELPERPR